MLLEHTISQLDIGHVPPEQAKELGHLGYIQWLGALPGTANYIREATRALELAQPFRWNSPAIAVFCDLLKASTRGAPRALDLQMRSRQRRGGSQARRLSF
ncbi:MAG: hypothetical protein OIF48_12480 [Silicimonas sp.]|nr:hypothetical protein [Silicimonas sp.]